MALLTFNAEDPEALKALLDQAFVRLGQERAALMAEIQQERAVLLNAITAERKAIMADVQAIISQTLQRLNGWSLVLGDGK